MHSQKLPENRKYLQATGKPPTVSYMLAFALKLIFQIIFQTMFLFMILWMVLFHERWENFRYYLNRNYFPKSAAYLSGFLILFAYILTTSGKGFEKLRFEREKSIFKSQAPNWTLMSIGHVFESEDLGIEDLFST